MLNKTKQLNEADSSWNSSLSSDFKDVPPNDTFYTASD